MKNVNKYFPKSNKTQKENMQQTKQGVGSTKLIELVEEIMPILTLSKQRNVMVNVFELKKWFAMNQTGKFSIRPVYEQNTS